MNHGCPPRLDEKNFWIPSEPLVSVKEKDHKYNSSLLKNGYAWKPGLHALVKLGKQSGVNTDAAEAVLNKAGATEADYVTAIRTLRKELRKVSQHPALNRFPTDPLF